MSESTLWGWGWLDTSENPIGNGTTKDVPQPAMILGNAKDFRIVPNTKELWVMEACYSLWGIKLLGKLAMVERCLVSQLLR